MSTANMEVSYFHTSKLLGYGSCTLYAHGFMVKEATQGETYTIILLTIVRGNLDLLRYHSVWYCHIHNNFHFVV